MERSARLRQRGAPPKKNMSKSLVIVESPTKAETIKQYLPKGHVAEASGGHIRDLPAKADEIPAKYKKEEWSRLGVNVAEDYAPLYIVPKDSKKQVSKLKKLLAECGAQLSVVDGVVADEGGFTRSTWLRQDLRQVGNDRH